MLIPTPLITSSTSEPVLIVSSMPIKKASPLRLLEVQFVKNRSWAAYGDAIVKRVNCLHCAIRRAVSVANSKLIFVCMKPLLSRDSYIAFQFGAIVIKQLQIN